MVETPIMRLHRVIGNLKHSEPGARPHHNPDDLRAIESLEAELLAAERRGDAQIVAARDRRDRDAATDVESTPHGQTR